MAWRRFKRACFTLRYALSFMVAPALGLAIVAATFGLSSGLRGMAVAMALLDCALMGLLVSAEMRRQAIAARDPPP